MVQNTDSFADVIGLLGRGPGPETAVAGAAGPAAPAVLDCRTALLAPEEARRLPTWQPLASLLAACRDDPARFQAEVLGRTLWNRQVAVCEAVATSPITVVPAGRAVGKSFLLAGLVLWWVNRRTANAFALRRRLDPHRDGFIPFYAKYCLSAGIRWNARS